jgi:phosphatidylglycerol:prolipoprotein diacylglycerol transferase
MINYIHWGTDPEIFNLFGVSIRYYGLFFVAGIIIANYILRGVFKKENIPEENLTKLSTYVFIGIFIGARLGHCFFYEPSYYLSHPLEMILPISFPLDGGIKFIGFQGLASHGGILGMVTAIYLYARKTKSSILKTMDLIAVVSGVAFGCIRLANFMNSEIIGTPTTKPWGIIFDRVDSLPRHPAQLYEAISYFIIFAILLMLYNKIKYKVKNGFFFGLGSLLFLIARIIIEFIKENQVGFEEGMVFNMGQLLSLPYIAFGIGLLIYPHYKKIA